MKTKKLKDYVHPNIGSTFESFIEELGPEFRKEMLTELIQYAWSEARLAVKKKKLDYAIKILRYIKKFKSEEDILCDDDLKGYAHVEIGKDIITAYGDTFEELIEEIGKSYEQLQEVKK